MASENGVAGAPLYQYEHRTMVIRVSTLFCNREIRKIREKNLDNQDTMQVGADQKKKLFASKMSMSLIMR